MLNKIEAEIGKEVDLLDENWPELISITLTHRSDVTVCTQAISVGHVVACTGLLYWTENHGGACVVYAVHPRHNLYVLQSLVSVLVASNFGTSVTYHAQNAGFAVNGTSAEVSVDFCHVVFCDEEMIAVGRDGFSTIGDHEKNAQNLPSRH